MEILRPSCNRFSLLLGSEAAWNRLTTPPHKLLGNPILRSLTFLIGRSDGLNRSHPVSALNVNLTTASLFSFLAMLSLRFDPPWFLSSSRVYCLHHKILSSLAIHFNGSLSCQEKD
jgi:hypothetical protein